VTVVTDSSTYLRTVASSKAGAFDLSGTPTNGDRMNATTPNTETHELTDAELNAVTGGFGGNLAAAVVKGVNTARDEYYLSQQH
jgi:bacteriocin-like protein